MKSTKWTRRQVLKGAGVALSVPWLETFETKKANAAGTAPLRRYMNVYWPNGTADGYLWGGAGAGASMTLAPILQPLQPNLAKTLVLGAVGNYSPWGSHVEPSHGNNMATSWTGVKANGPGSINSSISIDQAIGNQIQAANGGKLPTVLHSLQVGLSTLDSYTDGLPGPHSRSISWKDAATPLYKLISPQNVFDTLVMGGLPQGGNMTTTPDPTALRRQALQKSALDYIIESSQSLQTRLSSSDVQRMAQFLTSVRDLETRVVASSMPTQTAAGCTELPRPTQTAVDNLPYPAGFNRGLHATLMIDLVVMAYQCDLTRVVSFMLDDARSDFVYDFITNRKFSQTGSTAGTGTVAGYHGLQHAGDMNDGFATITYWNMSQLNDMVTKITAIKEGAGTAMDSTIIHAHSGMHGGNHDGLNIPVVLMGTGGGVFKTGQAINFAGGTSVDGSKSINGKNLQDVHLTILNKVFGATQAQFGTAMGSFVGTTGVISQLLA
jgi:uncharacterized protein DUF1552